MKKKRYHIRFRGLVQGVGFRYTATHLAERFGLTGWVYNEYDGSVISEVQGDVDAIEEWIRLIDAARYIEIDEIEKKEVAIVEDERLFEVKF